MLQTCTRCRNRRIKCDSCLPACANCAKNDLECTFRDDALQEDIPRSYIQSLNDKIEELTSQLALHRSPKYVPPFRKIAECAIYEQQLISYRDPLLDTRLPVITNAASTPLHILIPARPGSDLHLDNSVPSRFTRAVFEALPLTDTFSDIENNFPDHDSALLPNISYADRSQLAPSIVRFLLGRYNRCIKPQYDVLVPELLNHDGTSFKRLSDPQKFKILMACGIAAAREGYRTPNWKPLAQICRDWANELVTPIISTGDSDTLTAILLLLIYELAEPSRGITWELLDLAARTCLQLGWHQAPLVSNPGESPSQGHGLGGAVVCGPDEIRLMSILKDIEGSLQTIFNRPNLLSGSTLPTTSENEPLYDLYIQVSDQLYGRGGVYELQACPFTGEVANLMGLLETLQKQHPVVEETWLLFLPISFKHKQCIACFQEADEENTRGMKTLRAKVMHAASELVSSVYRTATSQDGFIPPIMACSRALISGCSIATGILKRWTPAQSHAKDLIKCTEILSMFAPHWKGGNNYLSVWRTIIDLLDLE